MRLLFLIAFSLKVNLIAAQGADSHKLAGTVLDSQGQPAQQATVFWNPPSEAAYVRLARTDTLGQFSASVPNTDFDVDTHLVVRHRNEFGFAHPHKFVSESSQTELEAAMIHLIPTTSIDISIATADGKPVADAEVKMTRCWEFRPKSLNQLLSERKDTIFEEIILRNSRHRLIAPQHPDFDPFGLLGVARTDEQGQATLMGIPQNSLVQLQLVGERMEAVELFVRTDGGEAIEIPKSRGIPNPQVEEIGAASVEVVANPSVPVRGVVTSLDDQTPISGVRVKFKFLRPAGLVIDSAARRHAMTDEQGRFEILGLPVGRNVLIIDPRKLEQPWIGVEQAIRTNVDDSESFLNFELPQGVQVRGVVRDRQSRQPIEGTVYYFVLWDNPVRAQLGSMRLNSSATSAPIQDDGTFTLTALPGPGFLAVSARGLYLRGEGAQELGVELEQHGDLLSVRASPYSATIQNFEYFKRIDPQLTDRVIDVELELSGPSVEVPIEFKTATRQPIRQVYFSGETNESLPFSLATFDFSRQKTSAHVYFFDALDDQRRLVQARTRDYKLAGWTFVHRDQTSAEIELFPPSTVCGRLVNADGTPVVGAQIRNDYWKDTSLRKGYMVSQPDTGYTVHTQQNGEFKIVGLPAGLPISVQVSTKNERGVSILRGYLFQDLVLKREETRDLGDIKVNELVPLRP